MNSDVRPIIMAIDDDPVVLNLTVGIVRKKYRVRPFTSTLTAVKYLQLPQSQGADLILLDFQMPDMNGLEAMAKIRELPAARDIPVIFLTGLAEDTAVLMEKGAAGVISKPPAPDKLLGEIEKTVRNGERG